MVSLLLNLKSVTKNKLSSTDFIAISQNSKLNIQNLMSVLERSLGSFRPVFHFKSMPSLKNLKAHFLPSKGFGATWPYPLGCVGGGKSKGKVLFF